MGCDTAQKQGDTDFFLSVEVVTSRITPFPLQAQWVSQLIVLSRARGHDLYEEEPAQIEGEILGQNVKRPKPLVRQEQC